MTFDPRVNQKAFLAKVRAELFHLVRLLSQKNYEDALSAIANPGDWSVEKLEEAFAPFYAEYQELIADPRARNPQLTQTKKLSESSYSVFHTLLDNLEENTWHLSAEIDLDVQREESAPFLSLVGISG